MKMNAEMAERRLRIIFAAMTLFLAAVAVAGTVLAILDHRAGSWRPVDATVLQLSGGKGSLPDVRYRYVVDGTAYESDRVRIIPLEGSGAAAQTDGGRIRDLRVGQKVQAWVDPDDPSEAVLLNSTSMLPIALIAAGLLGIAGMGMMRMVRRLAEERRRLDS